MTIEKIKCPRLNKNFYMKIIRFFDENYVGRKMSSNTPDLEVFVNFSQQPVDIMCDEYDSQSKLCNINEEDCTYKSFE